jgi:predicted permease
MQRVKALPGVKSATFMNEKPFTGRAFLTSAVFPGYVPKPGEDLANNWTIAYLVGPRYFGTLQMPLAAGRDFDERDTAAAPKVAILNESMARHYFGDRNPVGQRISFNVSKGAKPDVEIIGVVRDARYFDVNEDHQDAIFSPLAQSASRNDSQSVSFAIRTAADPDRMAADVRAALRSIDPNLPLYDFTTMNQQVQSTISQQRMMAMLSGFFGLLALTLSAIGLYGVLAYSVSRRTGEIGVRMALGADRSNILRMILGETGQLLGIGVIAGLGMSFAATRLIKTMLYGVTPEDPHAFLLGSVILVLVGLGAALLPARRAVTIEPMAALRYE